MSAVYQNTSRAQIEHWIRKMNELDQEYRNIVNTYTKLVYNSDDKSQLKYINELYRVIITLTKITQENYQKISDLYKRAKNLVTLQTVTQKKIGAGRRQKGGASKLTVEQVMSRLDDYLIEARDKMRLMDNQIGYQGYPTSIAEQHRLLYELIDEHINDVYQISKEISRYLAAIATNQKQIEELQIKISGAERKYGVSLKQIGSGFWINQLTVPSSYEDIPFKERARQFEQDQFRAEKEAVFQSPDMEDSIRTQ